MPLDTRSQDLKRVEDKIDESIADVNRDHVQKYDTTKELLEVCGQQPEESKINNEVRFEEIDFGLEKLQEIPRELTYQQGSRQQKLQTNIAETNAFCNHQEGYQIGYANRNYEICNRGHYSYKILKPKQDFSSFDGEDIHRWLYKYNQFFKVEEIHESENLKLDSYYLDEITFY